MKFNIKGLFAILAVVNGFAFLIYDMVMIIGFNASYTAFGMFTLLVSLILASIGFEYIDDRLGK